MSIRKKIFYIQTLAGSLALAVIVSGIFFIVRYNSKEQLGMQLLATAQTLAAVIDGDLHKKVRGPKDIKSPAFLTLRSQLDSVRRRLGIPNEHIYTLRPVKGSQDLAAFVIMTHPKPFVGDRIEMRPEMKIVLQEGRGNYSKNLYADKHGQWMSAYAPINDSNGKVVGVLEVDVSADMFESFVWQNVIPVAGLALVVIGVIVSISMFFFGRALRPLGVVSQRMEELNSGTGDLTIRIPVEGNDEIAGVTRHINAFIESVADVIVDVKKFTDSVGRVQDSLRAAMGKLNQGSRREAEAVNSTSASNEELNAAIKQIASNVESMDSLTRRTIPAVEELLQFIVVVEENTASVNGSLNDGARRIEDGRGIMGNLTEEMEGISRSSEQIEEIVKIIQSISDRIAMLALNASIEAARAGEYGRGFAVVAEEVSKLSDSTARQTKDITDIVTENRSLILQAVQRTNSTHEVYEKIDGAIHKSLELSNANVESARRQKDRVGSSRENLTEISRLTAQVASAIREQSAGADQISDEMTTLADINSETNLSLRDLAETIEKMEQNLQRLGTTLRMLTV